MSQFRVRYTDAFKEKAVKLILEEGKPLTMAAASLGIPNSVLSKWVKKTRMTGSAARPPTEEGEVSRLSKRIEKLENSLEVLRKIVESELTRKVEGDFPGTPIPF